MFLHSVDALLDWMEDNHGMVSMIECLEKYLSGFGEENMAHIAQPYSHLSDWAKEHDLLGWDNFLEGRTGYALLCLQQIQLRNSGSQMHILGLVHSQNMHSQ